MSHHAIIFEGEQNAGLVQAIRYIEKNLGLTFQGNPDISVFVADRLRIEDVRTFTIRAGKVPLGSAQVFIISVENIVREAQNALLKLLEEPMPNTYFIFLLPSLHTLLPTVRSRLQHEGKVFGEITEKEFATVFLQATIANRITMLKPITENKERIRARAFLDALEENLHKNNEVTSNVRALREITFVRTYISDRSSSLKMLLEHLAVIL